jgi:hypothetical protein
VTRIRANSVSPIFQAGHEGSIPFARSRFPSSERCLMSGVWPGSPQGSVRAHGRSITTQLAIHDDLRRSS